MLYSMNSVPENTVTRYLLDLQRGASKLSFVLFRGSGPTAPAASYLIAAMWHLLIHRRRYSVVLTVDAPLGIGFCGAAARLLSLNRIRHIAWVMDLYYVEHEMRYGAHSPKSRLSKFLTRHSLRHANQVITLGHCMQSRLAQDLNVVSDVLPLWIRDLNEERLSPSAARQQLGMRDVPTFLYSGHAGLRHPLGLLADVASRSKEEPYEIVVCGAGEGIEALRKRLHPAASLTLKSSVMKDDYRLLAASADAHIVALDVEATGSCVPSKTYAALSSGREVIFIGDERSQAFEDVQAAGAGVCIQTAAGLQRAIEAVTADTRTAARKGARGMAWTIAERSEPAIIARWSELLLGTINKPRSDSHLL